MVELFAVECLARSPGWSGPVPLVAQRELPTPARVERTGRVTTAWALDPPGGIHHPFAADGRRWLHQLWAVPVALSPTDGWSSDRTPGLSEGQLAGRRHYSGEPPSNRTSPSRGIRLYGPGTSRWAAPRPFGAWVRRASLGVPAMAEDADEGVVDALN